MQIFETGTPPNWSRLYYNRASDLREEAKWMFCASLILIGFGAVFFYYAQALTNKDLGVSDLDEGLKLLQTKLRASELEMNVITNQVLVSTQTMKDIITAAGDNPVGSQMATVFNIDRDGKIDSDTIADALDTLAKKAEELKNTYSINPFSAINLTNAIIFSANKSGLSRLSSIIRDRNNIHLDFDKMKKDSVSIKSDIATDNEEIEALKLEKNRIKAGLSPSSFVKSESSVLYSLVQTTITRFGGLAIITFVVVLLLSNYRYKIKLSMYYVGRGDAIALIEQNISDIGFVELSSAITPAFDFGKMPQTPMEQVIEIAKAMAPKKD